MKKPILSFNFHMDEKKRVGKLKGKQILTWQIPQTVSGDLEEATHGEVKC